MRYYPNPAENLDLRAVNNAIGEAFAEHGRGNVQMPPKDYVFFEKGDFRTMPGYIPSLGIAGVKVVNVHPDNRKEGLPTVMAVIVIIEPETGYPEAILNGTKLTDLRTAAAGAVAAKYLSPSGKVSLGVFGSGRQAQTQVAATALELEVDEIRVWSRNESHAESFCSLFPDHECHPADPEDVCGCDVIVTATPSREPIVKDEWISEGTHINAIGADAPGKEELDPAILNRATVIVDDPRQAVHSGEINVPIKKGLFSEDKIAGTLGEYVLGKKKRISNKEITVFDSTGLAIQDLAISRIAMENAEWIELEFS
ncbi:Ornithine cyclodeaminase [Methanolacinia petrolearia DSM 11571]|uniref:Alanine dehydrogenase n=1 Tax=Methanolacinia petrolearia (strain DSM 11571 / OCM 486 / SEBR 4847) TaxID=679926 RepID=E1RFL3_METP4|nr:alanine dehydrogenase [Methanolacinia petrolearia]ADN37317.1 Ornithine cyclodeaminase [Methanolacinia petrolearia DSM 11571]